MILRRAGVPEVVEAEGGESGALEKGLEPTVNEVGDLQRRTDPRGTDRVPILVEAARPNFSLPWRTSTITALTSR
jgi:hypothetical protein